MKKAMEDGSSTWALVTNMKHPDGGWSPKLWFPPGPVTYTAAFLGLNQGGKISVSCSCSYLNYKLNYIMGMYMVFFGSLDHRDVQIQNINDLLLRCKI